MHLGVCNVWFEWYKPLPECLTLCDAVLPFLLYCGTFSSANCLPYAVTFVIWIPWWHCSPPAMGAFEYPETNFRNDNKDELTLLFTWCRRKYTRFSSFLFLLLGWYYYFHTLIYSMLGDIITSVPWRRFKHKLFTLLHGIWSHRLEVLFLNF